MKWINHKILTAAIVFNLSGDLLLTGSAMIGSVLPDEVEKIPYMFGYTRKNHRQLSHWFIPYFLLFLGLYYLANYYQFETVNFKWLFILQYENSISHVWTGITSYVAAGIFLGACFHTLEDALCGTVPFLMPKQRIGMLFFKVGSAREYEIVIVSSLVLLYLSYIQS